MKTYDDIMTEAHEDCIAELREGLSKLPAGWQRKFKLMYGRDEGRRSLEDTEAMSIDDVIREVKDENLATAMRQVRASLAKLHPIREGE